MFTKTYHATHPDMMVGASNDQLRDRYLMEPVRGRQVSLNYAHNERFVIGGAAPVAKALKPAGADRARLGRRPAVPGAPRTGRRQRRRRRPQVTRRRRRLRDRPRDGLYVGMGAGRGVQAADGRPARFYLVRPRPTPASTTKISIDQATPLERGAPETSNERTIYQYIIPGVCRSAQLLLGVTLLKTGSVWNTMPPHLHDRRSEVYFYFGLPRTTGCSTSWASPTRRHIVVANEEAVMSPPWSIHMGTGTAPTASSGPWAARTSTTPTCTSSTAAS
jgi:4-deoxy-L-threo-5-hexosulose-uronate ketol-isomerase